MTAFASKTVVVTGGSSGIGEAIVRRFAEAGANVVFSYRGNVDAATELESATGATAVQVDLAVPDDIERLFAAATDTFGGLDVIVNNAAVMNPSPAVADVTDDEFAFVMDGNLRGSFLILRNAVRLVNDGGAIINISTLDTAHATAGNALYAASKAAIEQFIIAISQEVGARGITANTVSPGATDTPRLRARRSAEVLAGAVAATPLGRLGLPEDIANVVEFLAGPAGRWISGQNIRATGGLG